jgi:putative acetyltransferase
MAVLQESPGRDFLRIEALDYSSSTASIEAARALLLEYGEFVLAVEGPARFCFGKLEDEVNGLPGTYSKQGGLLLLAWQGGTAAGCVAYRALSWIPRACEMKRLWVRPRFRGAQLGERLTLAILERARAARYTAVYLDTMPESMGPAHRMYRRLGFVECPPFHGSVTPGLVFMRRPLETTVADDSWY